MIIRVKINVEKIDKAKLFKGKSGTYLDVTLLENRGGTDQYGNDFMVIQDATKEERDAGIKGAILGNAKFAGGGQKSAATNSTPPAEDAPPKDDSVPF